MKQLKVPEIRQIATYLKKLYIFISNKETQGKRTRKAGLFQLKMIEYFLWVLYNWVRRIRNACGDMTSEITPRDKAKWKTMTYMPDEVDGFVEDIERVDALNNILHIRSTDVQAIIAQTVKEMSKNGLVNLQVSDGSNYHLENVDSVDDKPSEPEKPVTIKYVDDPVDPLDPESLEGKKKHVEVVKKGDPDTIHHVPQLDAEKFKRVNRTAFAVIRDEILNTDPETLPSVPAKETIKFLQYWFNKKVIPYSEVLKTIGVSKNKGNYIPASDYPRVFSQFVLYLMDGTTYEDDIKSKLDILYESVDNHDQNWRYLVPWAARRYEMEAEQENVTCSYAAVAHWEILYENVFKKINNKLVKCINATDPYPFLFYKDDPQMMFEAHNISVIQDSDALERARKFATSTMNDLNHYVDER